MLGKLLKYEFKATGRILLPVFGVAIIAGLMVMLFPMSNNEGATAFVRATGNIIGLLFILFIFASAALGFFVPIIRFKNNILGSEGYLMNTLPVSPMAHIVSKTIVHTAYQIIGLAVTFLCAYMPSRFAGFKYTLNSLINFFANADIMALADFFSTCLFALLLIILFNVTVYASLSVGHYFNSAKLLKSIGVFLLMVIIGFQIMVRLPNAIPYYGYGYTIVVLSIEAIYAVAELFIANYFLKRRLNLE